MVFYVGLTGNIASGKSTVAARFANFGIDVISADQVNKELTASNQPAFHHIVDHFGPSVLTEGGELNRRYLRQLIFNDTNERRWLEKLLHPLIRQQIERDRLQCKSPYCLIEIPLIPKKSDYAYLNRVLFIRAEPEEQIKRLMARDNCSKDQALAILAAQGDETTHLALADDILFNNGSMQHLEDQVIALHEQYLMWALKSS